MTDWGFGFRAIVSSYLAPLSLLSQEAHRPWGVTQHKKSLKAIQPRPARNAPGEEVDERATLLARAGGLHIVILITGITVVLITIVVIRMTGIIGIRIEIEVITAIRIIGIIYVDG